MHHDTRSRLHTAIGHTSGLSHYELQVSMVVKHVTATLGH